MHHRRGVTLLEVAIVIGVLILLALILIPAWRASRRTARAMKAGTELCAIGKSLVLWSDQFYPQNQDFPRTGLVPPPANYTIASNSPTDRIATLCNMGNDPLVPKTCINSHVGNDVIAQGKPPGIVLHSNNLSYAVLEAENPEWKNKVNASAPILADKQVGKGSFWNKNCWEGDVGWGDTHVTWESGQSSTTWPATTINGQTTTHDDLFAGTTGPTATDAVLINP